MPTILHIFHSMTLGGAVRTAVATAKYSGRQGAFRHQVAALSLPDTDPRAVAFAMAEGLEVPIVRTRAELEAAMAAADIVQVNWWQHPQMHEFLRGPLPPVRLLGWFHCAGDHAPQRITEELVDIMDLAVAGSFYTTEAPGFATLAEAERTSRTAMVNGGSDFARLSGFKKQAHSGFNVSYIGTVDWVKMHPDFVAMSAAVCVPDVKFIVCGGPKHLILRRRAEQLEAAERFDFRGYVEDISAVLAVSDVYGYPLCEDTYAASELNLQDAMYCGIPPVVFPHGGIKRLVRHGETGLVVSCAKEYKEAIEHLYQNPEFREKLGHAAAREARERFGAELGAVRMNEAYQKLLSQPKRSRQWGESRRSCAWIEGVPYDHPTGAAYFIESLGGTNEHFRTSLCSRSLEQLLAAEREISRSSHLMRLAGVFPYRNYFREDPHLILWSGLCHLHADGDAAKAAEEFTKLLSADLGSHHWRVLAYIAIAAERHGDAALKHTCLQKLREMCPEFPTERVTSSFWAGQSSR